MSEITEAKDRLVRDFLGTNGVHGIGIGSYKGSDVIAVYATNIRSNTFSTLRDAMIRAASPYKVTFTEANPPRLASISSAKVS